jgi:hypothetical protein
LFASGAEGDSLTFQVETRIKDPEIDPHAILTSHPCLRTSTRALRLQDRRKLDSRSNIQVQSKEKGKGGR